MLSHVLYFNLSLLLYHPAHTDVSSDIPLPHSNSSVLTTHSPDSTDNLLSSNSVDFHPSAPINLEAAITSTRFVYLRWDMPDNTGSSEILAYSVYWRESGSSRYGGCIIMDHLKYSIRQCLFVLVFSKKNSSRLLLY